MRRLRALACPLALASLLPACSAPRPASQAPVRAPADGSVSPAGSRDWTALRARLSAAPVAGVVLFDRRVRLAPSAAEARAQTMPGAARLASFGAVRVLADEGDVVRITTELGQASMQGSVVGLRDLDSAFAIEAWLDKRALVPVLAKRIERAFPDGSAYVLGEGLPLALTDEIRPWEAPINALAVTIDEASVGLGFEVGAPLAELPTAAGAELGCEASGATTRVALASVLGRERAAREPPSETEAQLGIGRGSFGARTCAPTVAPRVGEAPSSTPGTLPILWKVREVPNDATRALVDVHVTRASMRGVVDRLSLTVLLPSGAGGIGRGPRPALKPKPGSRVVFPDGSPAGRFLLHGSPALTRVDAVPKTPDMLCTTRKYVSAPLCFLPGEAAALTARTFDDRE